MNSLVTTLVETKHEAALREDSVALKKIQKRDDLRIRNLGSKEPKYSPTILYHC